MNELQKVSFPVTGMACAACASSVQSMLGAQAGVSSASVNYGNKTARIEFDPAQTSISELSKSLQSIGYGLLTDDSTNRAEFEKLEAVRFQLLRRKLFVALILSLPVFVISMFFHAFAFQVRFALLFMTLPVMFYSGSEFFTNAFKQLRHRIFTMDALVATGTGAAFLLSLANVIFPHALHVNGHQHAFYFESAVIIISFVLAGRFFEEKAKAGASSAIRKLAGLQPRTVLVEREGEQFEVPAVHVVPGDRVTIRPGDKIPVDGLILSGISEVDESAITGEPMPVPRKPGDNVFAGSVNRQGLLEVEALKPGNETVLSQIIRLVEEAQSSKPPVQKLVDKIAGIFVPVVIGLAAITFACWLIFGDSLQLALLNMISVLIIACPCALGLATPTALIAGIGRGASEGILVRDAASLETACKVDTVVFDKTGTLTSGAPVATGIQLNKDPETTAALLYTLEKAANHPLADAVRAGLSGMFPPGASGAMKVTAFENIPGSGIKGVMDGREYVAGNAGFVSGFCQVSLNGKQEPQTPAESVLSEIYFASREELLAVITFTDKMNENTRAAVGALHREGLSLSIMSGDKEEATAALAKLAGIEHWHSGLMPADKGNKIREMQSQGKVVAMAGDGINDAYALAAANLGIAMGSGTDIAMESAGMVLVKPDISLVAKAISLSRSTVAIIRQNLFWAFFYNVVTIPLAAGLLYPFTGFLLNPMIAGAAMAMSSVSVVSNSLRLTKKKL